VLWAIGILTAGLTAFYMSRLVFLTFLGRPRFETEGDEAVHPHESPWTMTLPLVVLAVWAAVGGMFNLPFELDFKFLEHWLEPVVGANETHIDVAGAQQVLLAAISMVVALIGIAVAHRTYLAHKIDARVFERDILARAWRIDEGYAAFFGGPGTKFADFLVFVDTRIIDGAVNGVAKVVAGTATGLRRLQTGYVRNYALGMAVGAVLIVAWFLARGGL
jgi:NADH-quinone oxidoreductase subunit L